MFKKNGRLALGVVVACIGLTGCAHQAGYDRGNASKRATGSAAVADASQFSGADLAGREDLLSRRVYRFGYDRYDVRENDFESTNAHAQNLVRNPNRKIRVEGHTDERGSREYNIGLGERRGRAITQILLSQGASPNQISVVSYGKEKPEALGHDEDSYSLNRRAIIVYEE